MEREVNDNGVECGYENDNPDHEKEVGDDEVDWNNHDREKEVGDDEVDWNNLNDNRLLYLPIGGTGEIGMNFNLFHYLGKWLIVDCGAGFAGDDLPGVDMIIPDVSFIAERARDIVGMIITHAHEDHLGAVVHVWRDLGCPIYATKFTANFLKRKLEEHDLLSEVPIYEIEDNQLELGPFRIKMIGLTHSVPEMRAVAISTDAGVILHTGDWKLDDNPVVGDLSDIKAIEELGNEGVLALICDSTNVFSKGHSKSESSLQEPLMDIVKNSEKLVAVSMFSSNVARIAVFCGIAKDLGRKIAVLGRTLHNMIAVAQQSGYLEGIEFLDGRDLPEDCNRDKLLVICTGCQGDRLAAINRLSENSFRGFELLEGDTVVLSCKMIPGNEKRISAVVNRFVRSGIKVITEKTHNVHVSGHPYRDEIKTMYQLIKPKISVPVHGEHMHLFEHMKLAVELGVPEPLLVEDGDVVCFNTDNDGDRIIGKVKVGYFGLDGSVLLSPDSCVMSLRRQLSRDGIVIIVLAFDRRFRLIKMPTVSAPGCLDDKSFLRGAATRVEDMILASKRRWSYSAIVKSVKKKLKDMVLAYNGKRPVIDVRVEQI